MNPFTDSDLARLKESIPHVKGMDAFGIPALLARLEAAEVVVNAYIRICGDDEPDLQFMREAIGYWRKAAGE